MKPPRIVLDTNVLLSALLFRAGVLSWLRVTWQDIVCLCSLSLLKHDFRLEQLRLRFLREALP